jgi:hypothetical protein
MDMTLKECLKWIFAAPALVVMSVVYAYALLIFGEEDTDDD